MSVQPEVQVRSMTGFARVRRTIGDCELIVSIKTVNHRGLDMHFHTGPDLDPFENAMRSCVKRHVSRGHVDLRIQVTSQSPESTPVDSRKIEQYLTAFRAAARQYRLAGEPDLNSALRIPGIFTGSSDAGLPPDFEKPLIEALENALTQLNEFRSREGAQLAAVMLERNASVLQAVTKLEAARATAQQAFHERLKGRLSDLLQGVAIDPQRLLQEAAILADRSDIGEEIARLKIHALHLADLLHKEHEVGKKLDFLMQEMNRETNTILSKTTGIGEAGLGITEIALACKADIEKIREQALNLE